MNSPQYFIGLDIASDTFTAAGGTTPWHIEFRPTTFGNTPEGFGEFLQWIRHQGVSPDNAVLCMEATGVYGEALAYSLVASHYRLAVEPPLKVKRAFEINGPKTDPVDSQQIAEYAYRYMDELVFWQPPAECLEQIRVLLTTREQLTVHMTAHQNALHALNRKPVATPLAEQVLHQMLTESKRHLREIDAEIQRLIDQEPHWRHLVALLTTIPGVGALLAAHILLLTEGFQRVEARSLAAFIGICPYEHRSGKSVYHKSTSRHFGPGVVRKLLYLASLTVRTHEAQFKKYFLRKVAEGKSKRLVLNNIENKLLKIICAIIASEQPYMSNYRSVNPAILKRA